MISKWKYVEGRVKIWSFPRLYNVFCGLYKSKWGAKLIVVSIFILLD